MQLCTGVAVQLAHCYFTESAFVRLRLQKGRRQQGENDCFLHFDSTVSGANKKPPLTVQPVLILLELWAFAAKDTHINMIGSQQRSKEHVFYVHSALTQSLS